MKIYRIENLSGKGPYSKASVVWREYSSKPRPVPEDDGEELKKLYESADFIKHICGFKSLKQLFYWFSPRELGKLKKMGYYIVEFEVERGEVKFGKHQVMFPKEKAVSPKIWKWKGNSTKTTFSKYLSAKKLQSFKEASSYAMRK